MKPVGTVSLAASLFALAANAMTPADVSRELGLPCTSRDSSAVVFDDGCNSVVLLPGSRKCMINGVPVWMNFAAEESLANVVSVSKKDVTVLLAPIMKLGDGHRANLRRRHLRVILDPGHGGEDRGASSSDGRLVEKELSLDLAKRVGRRLARDGVNVEYTRSEDTFVELSDRTKSTGAASAFVSIHANSAGNASARGRETFVMPLAGAESTDGGSTIGTAARPGNANDEGNARLGFAVHSRLPDAGGAHDRGLRHARFMVLRNAECPATLVEVGFLSNGAEEKELLSRKFRNELAKAISRGILDFLRSN